MELAGRYAYAGREWVIERVRQIIGGSVTDMVHNHHNYAWRETRGGRELWVVRKGATPAFPGQRGFVGGSMGDDAVILEGVDSEEAKSTKARWPATARSAGAPRRFIEGVAYVEAVRGGDGRGSGVRPVEGLSGEQSI
jgi:RNA-splicing ligase RtcB